MYSLKAPVLYALMTPYNPSKISFKRNILRSRPIKSQSDDDIKIKFEKLWDLSKYSERTTSNNNAYLPKISTLGANCF